ncbi:MAG: hypothetical protein EU548_05575 [Promethearchaeota archaeon]|nr:MAG: hypothetical protein EU548_05575 [Candidatus Lokiarchaeota archaeon]
MSSFFEIYTFDPDNPRSEALSKVRLLAITDLFEKYPIVEAQFFDDLTRNIQQYNHYSFLKTIKRIIGPNKEDYKIQNWHLIWAMDTQHRFYQLLFQRVKQKNQIQGILVALAPPELAKLYKKHKFDGLLKTLTLLNSHKNIKFVKLLGARGKSIAEEQQIFQLNQSDLQKVNIANYLKNIPNIEGQWFPSFAPKCPVCGAKMKELKGYRIGFGKLSCPQCGYQKYK